MNGIKGGFSDFIMLRPFFENLFSEWQRLLKDGGHIYLKTEPDIWKARKVAPTNNRNHPSEKPVELLERMILNSSNEGDMVLDCFTGSGSTGVACVNTNRKFIGFELEKKYYDIAEKRIAEALAKKQQGLF